MTIQVSPLAEQIIYLPINLDTAPSELFINSISFFDITQNIIVANYNLQYASYSSEYFSAFVSYPQSYAFYISHPYNLVYRNEGIYDDKIYALVGSNLVTYADSKISVSPASQNNVTGIQYVAFYNDDVLIIYTVPYGVQVYSTKYNKSYLLSIPSSISSEYSGISSVSMLNNIIYVGYVTFTVSTVISFNSYILSSTFTYSNSVLSITAIYSSSSTSTFVITDIGSTIKSNINYVTLVTTITYVSNSRTPTETISGTSTGTTSGISTEVNYTVLDVNTGKYSTYTYSSTDFAFAVCTINIIRVNNVVINVGTIEQSTSIYAYYILSVANAQSTGGYSLTVISFNINTLNFEYVTQEFQKPQTNLLYNIMIQGNTFYYPIGFSNPIQYGNTYYLPVKFIFYQILTSEMLVIQFSQFALYKNTLTLAGTVKYAQTGVVAPNAHVSIYEYASVLGNQYAITKLITKTQADSNGNFSTTVTLTNSPSVENIIVSASIDPIILQPVIPQTKKPTVPPYYP